MLFDLLLSYYCEKLYFIRQHMSFNIGYSIIKMGFYNLIVGYEWPFNLLFLYILIIILRYVYIFFKST